MRVLASIESIDTFLTIVALIWIVVFLSSCFLYYKVKDFVKKRKEE